MSFFLSLDDFRIFCGDLGNEVNDDILTRAFSRYPSFLKAKVVRDKRTGKTKGYGFVSFKDPNDYVRAMREMNGEWREKGRELCGTMCMIWSQAQTLEEKCICHCSLVQV